MAGKGSTSHQIEMAVVRETLRKASVPPADECGALCDCTSDCERAYSPDASRWDTNHAGYRAVFNAALTGILANPGFFGPIMEGSPTAAVEFADEVVMAAIAAEKTALKSTAAKEGGES